MLIVFKGALQMSRFTLLTLLLFYACIRACVCLSIRAEHATAQVVYLARRASVARRQSIHRPPHY